MISTDVILIFLASYIVMQSVCHRFERKDLYTRIMCRDVSDYTDNVDSKRTKKPAKPSAHSKVLDEWRNGGER